MATRRTASRFRRLGIGLAAALTVVAGASTQAHATAPPPTVLLHDNFASADHTLGLPLATWPPYEPDTTIEPSIAVNPANANNAVASFHEGRDPNGGAADIGFATTTDGGNTWISGNVPHLTTVVGASGTNNHASDPVVAFGPGNVVYINSLVIDEDSVGNVNGGGLAISESKDGGLTWEDPIVMNISNAATNLVTGNFDDKNWITVDMGTGLGHHLGRVYMFWDNQLVTQYAYCDPDINVVTPGCDQLNAWSTVPNGNNFYVAYNSASIGSIPLVLQDGSVEDVFNDEGGFFGQVTAQSAGAVAWPAPLTFTTQETTIAPDDSGNVPAQRAGPDLPTAAVDPVSGRVAVGWSGTSLRSAGKNDPEVVVSTNNTGQTFGSPFRVDQGAPTGDLVDRYNTMLGFGADGTLRVGYRQRLEGAPTMSQIVDTYYQVSADFGATWSTPLLVDTQATDVGYCAFSRGGCFLGDYNELAPAGANTYLVREEAYANFPGEPYNNTTCFCANNGHMHQKAWVAVVGPPQVITPESPLIAALVLAGAGAAVAAGVYRRRRYRAPLGT